MNTITAQVHYRESGQSFVKEQPSMKEPRMEFYYDEFVEFQQAMKDYGQHLRSRPEYLYPSCTPEEDGRVGEFEIEEQFWEGSSWWPTKHLVDGKVKEGTKVRTIAIAHPQEKEEQFGNYFEQTKNLSCAICGYFCNNVHHFNNWFNTDNLEGSKASDITDESLFINGWKGKYVALYNSKEQAAWIETNVVTPMKSQIAAYRVLVNRLIERRDELLAQLPTPSEPGINPTRAHSVEELVRVLKKVKENLSGWEDTDTMMGVAIRSIDNALAGAAASQGEVERLKGLIENIFKANEEMNLDISEPRENIEINWNRFKLKNNL